MKQLYAGLFAVMLLFAASGQLNAQSSISVGLAYGFDIEEAGFQFGVIHHLNERMSIGGDFVYYLVDDFEAFGMKFQQNAYEVNGNFRFNFFEQEDLVIYGLGTLGLHILKSKITFDGDSDSETDSEVALGFGGGVQYNVGKVWIFSEPRLFISGFDQFQLTAGLRVVF